MNGPTDPAAPPPAADVVPPVPPCVPPVAPELTGASKPADPTVVGSCPPVDGVPGLDVGWVETVVVGVETVTGGGGGSGGGGGRLGGGGGGGSGGGGGRLGGGGGGGSCCGDAWIPVRLSTDAPAGPPRRSAITPITKALSCRIRQFNGCPQFVDTPQNRYEDSAVSRGGDRAARPFLQMDDFALSLLPWLDGPPASCSSRSTETLSPSFRLEFASATATRTSSNSCRNLLAGWAGHRRCANSQPTRRPRCTRKR
jgi:hypothetical protein